MRLRNIIPDIAIYVNNEEQQLLEKLPTHPIHYSTVGEREKVIADGLIRKSLVKKINNNGVILVQKNITEEKISVSKKHH